jgi:hypothetical protein
MGLLVVAARIVHVFGAMFWAGGGFVFVLFILPAVAGTMPASQKFMQAFLSKYTPFMGMVSGLTVLAGAVLYWIDSGGLQASWIATPSGIGFTLGSLAGLAPLLIGFVLIRPNALRLEKMGAELESQGKPPTQQQSAEVASLRIALARYGQVSFWMLMLAVLFMATSRYFGLFLH